MIRALPLLLAIACVLAVGLPAAAETVNCYDPRTGVVSKVGRSACEHEVITDERAEALRKARADYIKRSMQQKPAEPSRTAPEERQKPTSMGSGFFISADGHVVTNHHVIAGCRSVSVLTQGGDTVRAAVVSSSAPEDLALLKAETRTRAYAQIAHGQPGTGDALNIVGFPVRKVPRIVPMTMQGHYVGERPVPTGGSVLSVDALVWQGSSGSPVLNTHGGVVGVVFAKANIPAIFQQQGVAPDDRAYAMPARTLAAFLLRNGVQPHHLSPGAAAGPPDAYLVRVDCVR